MTRKCTEHTTYDCSVCGESIPVRPRNRRNTRTAEERAQVREAKTADAVKTLEAGLAQLVDSATYRDMLRTAATFREYSPNNYLMIWAQSLMRDRKPQMPVAGFRDWQKLGRHVRKGEKAYKVWAPRLAWVENDEGERVKRVVGFLVVNVFTFDQTEGEPLTAMESWRPTGDGRDGAYAALVRVATRDGWTITNEPARNGEQGYTAFKEKRINITPDQSGAMRVQTLAHELGHSRLHAELGGTYARRDVRSKAEIEAESTAFVVLHALGVELDDAKYSLGYVAHWASGDLKAIGDTMATVLKAARGILADAEELAQAAADADPFEGLSLEEAYA